MKIVIGAYRDMNGKLHGKEVDINAGENMIDKLLALEVSELIEPYKEKADISVAAYDLVEIVDYLFSNLENASDSQLEDIKQIRNIMDMLYLKALKEQFKRA